MSPDHAAVPFGSLDRDDLAAVTAALDRVLESLAAPAFGDLRREALER